MSKFFINTDGETPGYLGWSAAQAYDGGRISKITDTINGGLALDKLGNSIPSPFARIYVFRAAFDEIGINHDVNNSYSKLISECLDLLEFIYQFGKDIEVVKWGQSDLALLQNSEDPGHKRMYDAFSKALNGLAYTKSDGTKGYVDSIYLFKYRGALLGGSSPFTMVFTSPNIRRNLERIQAGGFTGLNGNKLFPDYSLAETVPTPLKKRSAEFQEFLTHYYLTYQNVLRHTSLGAYINHNGTNSFQTKYNALTQMPAQNLVADFADKYGRLRYRVGVDYNDVNLVPAGDTSLMPLAYKQRGPVPVGDVVNDDYRIEPTVDYAEGTRLPLVLSKAGLAGAEFVNHLPWNAGTDVSTAEQNIDVRILPGGMNISHPYVYADDFIEDYLVKLPYAINDGAFYTLSFEDGKYLLPIKKEYLKYFRKSDISRNLKAERIGSEIKLTLTVPVKYAQTRKIELSKTYNVSKILDLTANEDKFYGLALFPTYRVLNNDALNMYEVMTTDEGCSASIEFFALDKATHQFTKTMKDAPAGTLPSYTRRERDNGSKVNYYSVKGGFDVVEASFGSNARALLIPKFTEFMVNANNNITVGIDFGTTNSFVCYSDGANVRSLDIDKSDLQVFTLNKPNLDYGNKSNHYKDSMDTIGISDFYWTFMREFVPHLLGGDQNVAGFPFRSVVCEKSDVAALPNRELFSDISIGFNYQNETERTTNYKYVTNIKWLLTQNNPAMLQTNEARVSLFMRELAWIIKNEVLINYQSEMFTVYITYPSSMGRSERRKLKRMWSEAFDDLMGANRVTIDDSVSEGVAPILYGLGGRGIGMNTLNVDIGGGTTDILYIDYTNKKLYSDSTRFAGNDLWGDGVNIAGPISDGANGFFHKLDDLVADNTIQLDEEEKNRYARQKDMSSDSADIMSYMFKNDSVYKVSDYIGIDAKLKSILFVHFTALLYHIASVLKSKKIDPRNLKIQFTGMGSKYLSMISPSSDDIADIITEFFDAYGLESDKIDVSYVVNPKEITARGAIQAMNQAVRNNLNAYQGRRPGEPEQIVLTFDDTTSIALGDIQNNSEFEKKLLDEFNGFVDKYIADKRNPYVRFLQREFSVNFSDQVIEALKNRNNNTTGIAAMSQGDPNDDLAETPFFWPLKNAIIEATK